MCAVIMTKSGIEILVDEECYPILIKRPWRLDKDGYAVTTVRGPNGRWKNVLMHRFIMGATEGEIVDHKFGNKLDNRREFLRLVNAYQNSVNSARAVGGTSKYKGVSFKKQISKGREYGYWYAYVKKGGKRVYCKSFKTEEEAARAYDAAAVIFHGEYARLNFPLNNK